jgi:hypothetical protein
MNQPVDGNPPAQDLRRIPLPLRMILEILLSKSDRDPVLGDLEEFFRAEILPNRGWLGSTYWCWQQILFSLNSVLLYQLRRCSMRKIYLEYLNSAWRAIVGWYAVAVLSFLVLEIPYIVTGIGRITGIQFWGSYATLRIALRSGNAGSASTGYWNYLVPLLLMAFSMIISRSSRKWAQSGAAYLVLFASSWLAKLMIFALFQETDQLTHALRSLLPYIDVRPAKVLILTVFCTFTIAANFLVFRAILRSNSPSLKQRLGTFAIRYVLPIMFFSLLTAATTRALYDGAELNMISFLLALPVALTAWLLPYNRITRLPRE